MAEITYRDAVIRGIAQETGAGSTIKIYFNTGSIYGSTAGTGSSFPLLKNFTSTGGVYTVSLTATESVWEV